MGDVLESIAEVVDALARHHEATLNSTEPMLLGRSLGAALDDLWELESGMWRGIAVNKAVLAAARGKISHSIEASFQRFRAAHEQAARDWLADRPLRPDFGGIHFDAWRESLGLGAGEAGIWNYRHERARARARRRDAALSAFGLEAESLNLAKLGEYFGVRIPQLLVDAWRPGKKHRRATFLSTDFDVIDAAEFVSQEHLGFENLRAVPGKPFPALPFAKIGESDYWVLDLAAEQERGDYRVLALGHDVPDVIEQFDSSEAWLRRRRRD